VYGLKLLVYEDIRYYLPVNESLFRACSQSSSDLHAAPTGMTWQGLKTLQRLQPMSCLSLMRRCNVFNPETCHVSRK
jgi:hypothetical protein